MPCLEQPSENDWSIMEQLIDFYTDGSINKLTVSHCIENIDYKWCIRIRCNYIKKYWDEYK